MAVQSVRGAPCCVFPRETSRIQRRERRWRPFARADDELYRLLVSDTGLGMSASGPTSERGTGGRLVRSLAQQLGGELSMESDAGLAVKLVFPLGARL